jgi:hypothetical protein
LAASWWASISEKLSGLTIDSTASTASSRASAWVTSSSRFWLAPTVAMSALRALTVSRM